MIQLFLIVIILVILIVKLNTKETFFQESCGKTVLYAMNSYIDTDDNKKPCIDLIVDEDIRNKSGYILIKNKHNNHSPLITEIKNATIKDFDITTSASALPSNSEMTRTRLQLSDKQSLELNNTYLITLNIKNEDDNYTIYDTIEITFKDVNLSNDDLNLNNNCNNIIESLKNKKIILNI